MADPVVVHALGVFGVSDDTGDENAAIDLKFIANYANNRYPLARPVAFLKDFVPIDAAPLDFAAVHKARFDGFDAHHLHLLCVGRISKHRDVVRVQM